MKIFMAYVFFAGVALQRLLEELEQGVLGSGAAAARFSDMASFYAPWRCRRPPGRHFLGGSFGLSARPIAQATRSDKRILRRRH
jgi:hypothetical protein